MTPSYFLKGCFKDLSGLPQNGRLGSAGMPRRTSDPRRILCKAERESLIDQIRNQTDPSGGLNGCARPGAGLDRSKSSLLFARASDGIRTLASSRHIDGRRLAAADIIFAFFDCAALCQIHLPPHNGLKFLLHGDEIK